MSRPTVHINKPNQLDSLRAHLQKTLPRFLPGVIGITLNGGLSRGYGDHLSEIDVTFYLEPATYHEWQRGHAPFGTGIQMIDGALYDLKLTTLADDAQWSSDALWDASYAEILYDPSGAVAALLQEKLAKRPKPADAGGLMFSAWWHYKLAGDIWIYRGDVLQGHLMLNQAVQELVKALFVANSEFIPHEKWLIHMSRSLDWQPVDWIARLTQILCDLSPTVEGLQQRQTRIAALWEEIDRFIVATIAPDYPLQVMHKYFYDLLVLLVEQGAVPVEEWETRAGLDLLNNAPFNLCTSVQDGRVVFDRAACAKITANDLYEWHYAIVKAIQARL